MIHYRDPRPACEAYYREQERAKPQPVPGLAEARYLAKTADLETLARFDLRPTDEILAEITARHPGIGITAASAAALEAYPISAEALAEDADQERARLLLLKARSDRRKTRVKAKRTRERAKAAAAKVVAETTKRADKQRRWWAEYRRLGHMPMFTP